MLGDGGRSNASSPLINRDCRVPNRPHNCTLFVGVCTIPYMWLIELVIFQEVALQLLGCMGLVMEYVNDLVHGHLHGIIKKVTLSSTPPPIVHISSKHANLP